MQIGAFQAGTCSDVAVVEDQSAVALAAAGNTGRQMKLQLHAAEGAAGIEALLEAGSQHAAAGGHRVEEEAGNIAAEQAKRNAVAEAGGTAEAVRQAEAEEQLAAAGQRCAGSAAAVDRSQSRPAAGAAPVGAAAAAAASCCHGQEC